MSRLALYMLGPPRIERDGVPVRSAGDCVALVAYLALTGRSHSRDALATLFWPELDQTRARAGLRRILAALRTALGEGGWRPSERRQAWPPVPTCGRTWPLSGQLAECKTHGHARSRSARLPVPPGGGGGPVPRRFFGGFHPARQPCL